MNKSQLTFASRVYAGQKHVLSLGPLTPNFHLRLGVTNTKKIIIITSAFQDKASSPCQHSFPKVSGRTFQVSLNSHKTSLLKSHAFFIESIYCNRFYTIYSLQNSLHFKIIWSFLYYFYHHKAATFQSIALQMFSMVKRLQKHLRDAEQDMASVSPFTKAGTSYMCIPSIAFFRPVLKKQCVYRPFPLRCSTTTISTFCF